MSEQRIRLAGAALRVDQMPAAGRDIDVVPDAEERAALAAQLGVDAITALAARLHALRFRGGFRVTGRLTAEIVQPSVVTLALIPQHIDEEIDRIFLPGGEKEYAGPANAEIFVDLEGDDLPDHFEGNEADLSDLIIESLALAVELYPREPGASLADTGFVPDTDTSSPFDVLKALREKDD